MLLRCFALTGLAGLLVISAPVWAQGHSPSKAMAGSRLGTEGSSPVAFTARSAPDIALFPFFHGVASGDPLENSVVIWTRITTDDPPPLTVNWRMATDSALANVVANGSFATTAARDFTVKVDVTGLNPNTWYYYEFEYQGRRSLIGRTRTAPAAGSLMDSLRFALVSCSNYQAGYFNAYANIASRNDIDAVLHVGDYIYEYETGGYGFEPGLGRDHDPDHEIITLGDYRLRHSWYKLDDDLRDVHQQYPFIAIYDDHEFANDAWENGADNHNVGEGAWVDRRSAAFKAWLEWMPVREPSFLFPNRAYRNLAFGDLLDFFVVDTRVEGRDEQDLGAASDPGRSLLGAVQFAWLNQGLRQSTATWKVMVNQVMFAPLEFFGAPINADQWDGYSAERSRLIDSIQTNGVGNFVVLTGDIHSAFTNNIPAPGGPLGPEFICTSVTSPGLDIAGGEGLIQLFNSHVRYVDLSKHGYVLLDFNQARVQGEHWYVNTILSPDPGAYPGASYRWDVGTSGLIAAGSVSSRPGPGPARPPEDPVNSCAIPTNPTTSGITATEATFQWDATPSAVGYLLQGQEVGAGTLRGVKQTGTSRTLSVFLPGRDYIWRVASSCDAINRSPFTDWQTFTTDTMALRSSGETAWDIPVLEPRLLGVYPVPFVDRIGVHLAVSGGSPITAALIDIQGRVWAEQDFGVLPTGAYFREWEAGSLSAGTYILRVCAGTACSERAVIKQ